jgi:hypothetical protein
MINPKKSLDFFAHALTIENEGLDFILPIDFPFIFNVRVNPDNADNVVSIRHPSDKNCS